MVLLYVYGVCIEKDSRPSTMEPLMITCISSLPVELVGIHVFSYLLLEAMVRLDSAVVQKRHRGAMEEAFAFSTVQTVYKKVAVVCENTCKNSRSEVHRSRRKGSGLASGGPRSGYTPWHRAVQSQDGR
jgi:hypothetical protein